MPTVARITAAGDFKIAGTLTEGDRQPTFSRASTAYKQDGTQVAANIPRFEAGKFGQAVMVEEGTTNLVRNPSFEDTGYWGALNRTTEAGAFHGSYACKVTYNWSQIQQIIGVTPGGTYTISAYGKYGSGTDTRLVVVARKSDGTIITEWNIFWGRANWERKSLTITVPDETARLSIYLTKNGGENNYDTNYGYIDAVQVEAKPYATSFVNGTRSPEVLTIPTAGVLNPQEGTVEVWVYVPPVVIASSSVFWHTTDPAAPLPRPNTIRLMRISDGRYMFVLTDANNQRNLLLTSGVPSPGWHLFSFRWSQQEAALFVDGTKQASVTNPYLPSALAAVACVGHGITETGSPWGHVNTLIDDLRISSRARTDEEIAAGYASGQPLPVDEWTTYKLNFDNSLTAIAPIRLTSTGDFRTAGELIEAASNFVIDQSGNLRVIGELIEGVTF